MNTISIDLLLSAENDSERERAQQALQQSEAYLAEAQRLTQTGSWACNYVTQKITYYSDGAFRVFGQDRDAGLPSLQEIWQCIHPDDRERVLAELDRVCREKAEYQQDFRIALPGGIVRHLHLVGHPVLDREGKGVEYFGTVMDVTERKRAEHRSLVQLRIARVLAEAATVNEAMPQILQAVCEQPGWDLGVMWRIDRDAAVLCYGSLWCKPSLRETPFEAAIRSSAFRLGYGLPGRVWASGAPAFVRNVNDDPEFHDSEIAAREGFRAACAFPILLGSEVLGVIELVSREAREPRDDLMIIVGAQLAQFIERKRTESALQLAQAGLVHVTRVMTLGELTVSIAHEVNQPLGAIVTSAGACERWLAAQPPQMEKARRALERIVNDGRRAGEVIKRMRALMKRQAPRKEWLDLNETILEVIALASYQLRRSEILIETRLGQSLPPFRGDRVQLQQVLLNLIVNAIEAMSGIKDRARELTIVSASDGPDTVCVEVRDSGTGLDPEHANHLFEAFYTTKAEGLGIGLSISRSIIETHSGRLWAAANVPHGTVFLVSLPVNEMAP
jgi:PAS domain S-box-containing protein